MPAIVAVIPARMASTRFPGKMLAAETGTPLIVHVAQAAAKAPSLSRVVVAADDGRILDAVRTRGIDCVLTAPDHPNGTSRLAEAADQLGLPADTVVVNVQGDEPEIEPSVIDAAVGALAANPAAAVSTVAAPMSPGDDPSNPNIVKVVCRRDGTAMYFSRSRVPFVRDPQAAVGADAAPLRHVGLYCYRRSFLATYRSLAPTAAEQAESLEQLRVLEHGHTIAVAVVPRAGNPGIDTPEQYAAFVARWKEAVREPAGVLEGALRASKTL
jgi:3-deoxy-manno-octulosonate cytidylyltransferase (CMP-KDO synthetase)